MHISKNQDPSEERPAESLGSRFRRTRTSLGKTLPEAAEVTRINPDTLTALEADDFAKLPAEVFTRGFVKLYAQYLGLDVNETVKLYTVQENLDLERPTEQPYRRDILSGTSMAKPLSAFKANPRLRIIAILLTLLVCFYVLGAIMKTFQKHPDQAAPENELAKSLVDSKTPPLPGAPGEAPPPEATAGGEVPGATTPASPAETPAGATGTAPAPAPAGEAVAKASAPSQPLTAAPTGESLPATNRQPPPTFGEKTALPTASVDQVAGNRAPEASGTGR